MKWYIEKLKDIENNKPVISACGDDCAVCPRYIAKTDEELHETAAFWHKIGWRDRIVSNEEISCEGCGSRPTCSFEILPCREEKNVKSCKECREFCCEKIRLIIKDSEIKESAFKAMCKNGEEFRLLKRAFYEKRKNLGQ